LAQEANEENAEAAEETQSLADQETPEEVTEATENTEAAEVTEATEAAEVTEAAEATEATEVTEATEATEATEVTEATEAMEATEVTEAPEILDDTVSAENQFDVAVAASDPVVLAASPSCWIDSGKVSVSVQVASGTQTDDGMLYLFAVPTYVDSVDGQTPIASVAFSGSGSYQLQTDLNQDTTNSLLYSKFYVGVKNGSVYTALNSGSFITNPEVLASSNVARTDTASKKGIHMSLSIPTDLETLGIKQAYFNICFDDCFKFSDFDNNFRITRIV